MPAFLPAWQQPYVAVYFHKYSISGFSVIHNGKRLPTKDFFECKNSAY